MAATVKFFPAIFVVAAFLSSSLAQQAPQKVPPEARSVLVSVCDRRGVSVRDLSKDNFRVRLNGKPVIVLDAHYSVTPRRIVVLLDVSGSMTNGKSQKWQIARAALDDLLTVTPPEVPLAMLTFSRQVQKVFDFRQGRPAIANWLKENPEMPPKSRIGGPTALLNAILEGLKLLQPSQPGDVVYAITDGGDNVSQASKERVTAAMLSSGVRLFAFVFEEPTSIYEHKDDFLATVADSGGFAFGVAGSPNSSGPSRKDLYLLDKDNQKKVLATAEELNLLVHGFWTLDLAASPSNKNRKLQADVVDQNGTRKDVLLLYPRLLLGAK